ncbi:M50 family metallopeptidase [Corynebacterium massiliense]|uniref:Zinc metalloprotease Rip1 n=1 Tax=Corynebacterium massiliense DSM 45435 TaxID=1121364 RepID=A0ABY7U905_9CORY|nr:site-2 protease family protein [Corynebacterium massiliense]WCZ32748.1 Zinc metalloprotease Rip1 [Corynebacterium massiliense DSM 45435]
MANILGILAFALGIGITIALHEAGHMVTARAFGMRVRRYFIGFGPTLLSFRRGHTEYGLAALPVGGYCDIAGMTAQDENLTEEEAPHAMCNKPWWQRVAVMLGGIAVNLVLGFTVLYLVAVTAGIPDPNVDVRPRVGEVKCVADADANGKQAPCEGSGPAGAAGVKEGDIVVAVDGHAIEQFTQLRDYVLERPGEHVTLTVERDGSQQDLGIDVAAVKRPTAEGDTVTAGSVGLVNQPQDIVKHFGPAEAVPATAKYSWSMLTATVQGIAQLPAKVPGVVGSIFGGERAQDSPMSVVGASRVGGELVERSLWSMFFMMLATLNFFLALFNLIPVPPFDGGHVAVIVYEKIRDAIRRLQGKAPAGPADYTKLMPLTYAIAAILMGLGAIFIVADVVNPVRLFG